VPGKPITQLQVKLYMSNRSKPNYTQASAAASAGFSERTARRIEQGLHTTVKQPRDYKTRQDPLNGLFETHLVPLLEKNPGLQPITLLDVLDEKVPGCFGQSHLRTLQRRVKRWRAKHGPEKEVIFQQRHIIGDMGISDYTQFKNVQIHIGGQPFNHKLYHFRLVYSGWTYVQIVFGGESFESLSCGLQNALWQCGGVPLQHRTDSLSAAFKNHSEKTLLTERYQKLCQHYSLRATRNNPGIAHENGAIEGPNGHFKRKIEQQLMLREKGSHFDSLKEYQQLIEQTVAKINRQCRTRFNEEKAHLKALPGRRTNDFVEQYARVSSSSTIAVKRVTYTVPSRLIGADLLVHIFDDHLQLFYGHEPTLRLKRLRTSGTHRLRSVDYRHVIHSLAKKPNAFKCSLIRDDLVPLGDFRLIWHKLIANGVTDDSCYYMVNLLLIAKNYDCEQALGRYVLGGLDSGVQHSIEACRTFFKPATITVPAVLTQQHDIKGYDCLMGGLHG
jgi:hypothetical protein